MQANLVHFTPGARTAWHTHPLGQTIYVTEGVGLCQKRGGPIEVIRPGDRVSFEPDEDHWHGAAPNRFMAHLALNEVDARPRRRELGRQGGRRRVRRRPYGTVEIRRQTPARVNVTCVTPLGEEVASTS